MFPFVPPELPENLTLRDFKIGGLFLTTVASGLAFSVGTFLFVCNGLQGDHEGMNSAGS